VYTQGGRGIPREDGYTQGVQGAIYPGCTRCYIPRVYKVLHTQGGVYQEGYLGVYPGRCIPGGIPRCTRLCTTLCIPGYVHPVPPWVYHHPGCMTVTAVRGLSMRSCSGDRPLGSEGEKPVGRGPLSLSGTLKCGERYTRLRRVTPLSLRERDNDRIDEGTITV